MPTLDELDPTTFENLAYDLVCLSGLNNAVWRTPGADGGRDIEGLVASTDFSGHIIHQRWYVECKRYASSIDWPTVYEKVAYAESNSADYLLVVTNSNPSPNCETEVSKWNNRNRAPRIRFWRGYEVNIRLNLYPQIKAKYEVGTQDIQSAITSLRPLFLQVMKIVQSAYDSSALGSNPLDAVEACAAIAEFVFEKVDELENSGKITAGPSQTGAPSYVWLQWKSWEPGFAEASLRALLCMYRYLRQAQSIDVDQSTYQLTITGNEANYEISGGTYEILEQIAFWGFLSLELNANNALTVRRI